MLSMLSMPCSHAKILKCVQIMLSAHPPKRGVSLIGTCPKVHTGFYKAWTANSLHTEVMDYLQVMVPFMVVPGHQLGDRWVASVFSPVSLQPCHARVANK